MDTNVLALKINNCEFEDVMGLFKKRNRIKTDGNSDQLINYNYKIKEIDNFLEKNDNGAVESRNNIYVEKRNQLIPHKPKYFEKY